MRSSVAYAFAATPTVLTVHYSLFLNDFLSLAFEIEGYILCVDESATASTRSIAGSIVGSEGSSEAR